MSRGYCRRTSNGLHIHVRATPKSSLDAITGIHHAADGSMSLAVKVSAAPDKGKANTAVIQVLATALQVQKSRVSILAGETSRHKTVQVVGDPVLLENSLIELEAKLGGGGD